MELMTQVILAAVGILTAISSLLGFINKQQIQVNRAETKAELASMELRLSEKISDSFVGWQAHNTLIERVDRIERICLACPGSSLSRRLETLEHLK